MRKLINNYLGIIFLLILAPSCKNNLYFLSDSIQEEIEMAVDNGLDGAIVCVNKANETILYAAGWKNRENRIPADPHALFKIASISKLYIAAATAKMISADQLSLDKTLADYLPEIASRIEYSDKITLRMLLQHRSGIPDYTNHKDYPWEHPYENASDTYELVYDMPADFEPDKKYSYSNTNYLLIGDILDTTLGYSHHQYIRETILEPLELSNTYSLMSEVDMDDLMSGYFVGWEPDVKVNDFVQPGGSMVATAEDVAIFLRALNDGSLFTNDEQEIYSSIYVYQHTGLLPGYSSIAEYHEDLDAVVVLFVNTSSEGTWFSKGGKSWQKVEKLYRRIIRILKK